MELDLRALPARAWPPALLAGFDRLETGATLVLITDEDPALLSYQLDGMRFGQFGWDVVARGPSAWRVWISKCWDGR